MSKGWIGVDFDGTLVTCEPMQDWLKNPLSAGKPIQRMITRVQGWLREGKEVRIMTARVWRGAPAWADQERFIQDWCGRYIGTHLPVTNVKDFDMLELWDDRAREVIPNTGLTVLEAQVANQVQFENE